MTFQGRKNYLCNGWEMRQHSVVKVCYIKRLEKEKGIDHGLEIECQVFSNTSYKMSIIHHCLANVLEKI